jgi:hypothetical protein
MDKDVKHFLNKIPSEYEVIKPILAVVIIRSGKLWKYRFVVARSILIDMAKASSEIDVDIFWRRFEDRLNNPQSSKMLHRLKTA